MISVFFVAKIKLVEGWAGCKQYVAYDLHIAAYDETARTAVFFATYHARHTGEGGPVPPTNQETHSHYVYSEQVRSAVEGDTAWTEWHWSGTHADGSPFAMRGVTIFGVRDDRIVWGRLYMEPVQQTGADIDAQIQRWAHGTAPENE